MSSNPQNNEKGSTTREGNVEADQNYRKSTREFVESGKVDQAAERARNMSEKEQREAEKAEQVGESKKKQ